MLKMFFAVPMLLAAEAALAQEAAAAPAPANPLPMMVVLLLVMYFMLIRPSMKQKKQHMEMISSLRRGDVIISGGGIRGTITRVEEGSKMVHIEIAPGVEVAIVRTTIAEVEVRKGAPANDATPAQETKGKKLKKK